MREEFLHYSLEFKQPIPTGMGTWRIRRGAWLRVEAGDGRVGFGEAAPLDAQRSAEIAAQAVMRGPAYESARDLAMLDIEGQRAGLPIAALLGEIRRTRVQCNALCFATDVGALCKEALAAAESGFRTIKIKVGATSPTQDIARVQAVRRRVGKDIRLRLDANGAWTVESALTVMEALKDSGIEYVEDPIPGDLSVLRGKASIPVASDIRSLGEAWRLVYEKKVDVIVIKPMALGGLATSHKLALAAIESGIGVVVSSVFESPVGVAGALHLAASLPGPERAHGLATVPLLESVPIDGLELPVKGELRLPTVPGLGVRVAVARLRSRVVT